MLGAKWFHLLWNIIAGNIMEDVFSFFSLLWEYSVCSLICAICHNTFHAHVYWANVSWCSDINDSCQDSTTQLCWCLEDAPVASHVHSHYSPIRSFISLSGSEPCGCATLVGWLQSSPAVHGLVSGSMDSSFINTCLSKFLFPHNH